MPLDSLGANHIGSQAPDGYEIQRTNNGLLHIAELTDAKVLTLSLASFPIPKVSHGIIEVPYLNQKRKFAGGVTYDDLSIIYKDYVNKPAARALLAWHHLIHNSATGVSGRASIYKRQARIELFGPEGEDIRQYDLQGCWPSAFDGGEVDMAGEDAVQITMTLTYDLFIPTLGFAA